MLSGLGGVAEGRNGGDFQFRLDAQRRLDRAAVSEGQPAGAETHVLQLQHQILHHVARVFIGKLRFFGQQHQILGRAHQELIVARRALQRLAGVVAENPQLGADARHQPLAAAAVVGLQFRTDRFRDLLIRKLPGRFPVLNQSIIIHG